MEPVNLSLGSLRHEIVVEKAVELWPCVEQPLRKLQINLAFLTC